MSEETPPLIRFLEAVLGEIQHGSIYRAPAAQAVFFKDRPVAGAITVTTLGLSNHELAQDSKRTIRQELIFGCYERFKTWDPDASILTVASDIIESHRALQRGQVLGPAGNLYPESSREAPDREES